MIEINLLPGARKAKRGGKGPSVDVGAALAGITSNIRDPILLSAIGALVVAIGAVGFLFTRQGARAEELQEREQKAIQDSTRYAAVLTERTSVSAQRDSVVRQIRIIQALDGQRFVWPHVMDEVSRALPPFTWITSLQQTGPPPVMPAEDELGVLEGDSATGPRIALVGRTMDIQALTRFMRVLEASPFLENVQLLRSDVILEGNKQVTEFRLDLRVQKPDSSAIRVTPFKVQVR